MQLDGVALVTGASGGIGGAVARALAGLGMNLCITGRNSERLAALTRELAAHARPVLVHPADLSRDADLLGLAGRVAGVHARVDVLVHAAGTIRLGHVELSAWDDLDALYQVDLRAPFLLTKALLPQLKQAHGQVVFINSTAGLVARADNGLYAAAKHALRSLAESVRAHVNQYGVRVLSVYPGRTLTAMQKEVERIEGRCHDASELLRPADVADMIVAALALPRTAEVTDIVLRPMKKPRASPAPDAT